MLWLPFLLSISGHFSSAYETFDRIPATGFC